MKKIMWIAIFFLGLSLTGCATHSPVVNLPELQNKAETEYFSGKTNDAETLYLKLTTTLPQDAEAWFRLGNIYSRSDRPEDAIASYRRALQADPQHTRAWYNLGLLEMQQAYYAFEWVQAAPAAPQPLKEIARHMALRLAGKASNSTCAVDQEKAPSAMGASDVGEGWDGHVP